MKKILILCLVCILLLAGFGIVKMQTTTAQEATLTGALTEPYVIDTEDDFILTLDNVNGTFEDSAIKVNNAKSVTIVLVGENSLESTGDVETVEPKVISSNADLIFKGDGVLTINSTDTCIKSKSNLTIESGTYNLTGGTDGKGLRANYTMSINGGTFNIRSGECLEATNIIINDGEFNLSSSDDAINAANKIDEENIAIVPCLTINGGNIKITMDQGDTDGIDSNGDLIINAGTIYVTAQSAFDWDGELQFNGGTVIVNGEKVTEITNQFEGGETGMPGEMPGGPN